VVVNVLIVGGATVIVVVAIFVSVVALVVREYLVILFLSTLGFDFLEHSFTKMHSCSFVVL